MLIECRSMVVWGEGGARSEKGIARGIGKLWGVINMFIILIVVKISWVCGYGYQNRWDYTH